MKKHKAQHNGNGDRPQPIRIEFAHPSAARVAIAGTFNGWRPDATQMIQVTEGRWFKELVLPPGRYEYRLVVDGEWMADPRVCQTTPNPFGQPNSVLLVGSA